MALTVTSRFEGDACDSRNAKEYSLKWITVSVVLQIRHTSQQTASMAPPCAVIPVSVPSFCHSYGSFENSHIIEVGCS